MRPDHCLHCAAFYSWKRQRALPQGVWRKMFERWQIAYALAALIDESYLRQVLR